MQADEARRIGNTFRNETQIEIKLDIDGTGKHELSTGIHF